ncbi:MAG: glycosyltransferase family 4 protein [Acidimicrobiaceae bacterium]|nr:glycosyltransferase family 4 protein [Acidimicrobiaceae bacterium]
MNQKLDNQGTAPEAASRPKISFVTPRFGSDITGGAEFAARMIAERLAKRGYTVEALTTVAGDIASWEASYDEGEKNENGVIVKRFAVDQGRSKDFAAFSKKIEFFAKSATADEAMEYIRLQGPVSQGLIDAISDTDSDFIAFYPYLYHPVVHAMPQVLSRSVLHPAAHDEAALYLPIFNEIFEKAGRLVFHTYAEEELVKSIFRISQARRIVLGLGIDPAPPAIKLTGQEVLGLSPAEPYLCALGRVDTLKGTTMLAHFVSTYRERHQKNVSLALVGPVAIAPDEQPWLKITGQVSEEEKWAILRDCTLFVSPSYYESFSLVIMEAWSVGVPVLVNGRCAATTEHVIRSKAGAVFQNYPEFEVALELLLDGEQIRNELGQRGKIYVEKNFTWGVVIDRYINFLFG